MTFDIERQIWKVDRSAPSSFETATTNVGYQYQEDYFDDDDDEDEDYEYLAVFARFRGMASDLRSVEWAGRLGEN